MNGVGKQEACKLSSLGEDDKEGEVEELLPKFPMERRCVNVNLFNQQSFCGNTLKLDNNEMIFIAHKLNSIFAPPPLLPYPPPPS